MVAGFLLSEEFTDNRGQSVNELDNGEQVDLPYQTLLQRDAEAEGRAYWINDLGSGVSLEGVAAAIALSEEASGQHLQNGEWDFIL